MLVFQDTFPLTALKRKARDETLLGPYLLADHGVACGAVDQVAEKPLQQPC